MVCSEEEISTIDDWANKLFLLSDKVDEFIGYVYRCLYRIGRYTPISMPRYIILTNHTEDTKIKGCVFYPYNSLNHDTGEIINPMFFLGYRVSGEYWYNELNFTEDCKEFMGW